MKTCTNCGEHKLNENFNKNLTMEDDKSTICRNCTATKRKQAVSRNRHFVWGYLLASPCIDCGEPDRIVLQFDHRDGVTKKGNLSDMVNKALSIQTLTDEIAKCDVRCANCHHRRTAKQQKWYSY
jgi:hypothetical protein